MERFLKCSAVDSEPIWEKSSPQLTLVVATPNGWEVQRQQTMRNPLLLGFRITTSTDSNSRHKGSISSLCPSHHCNVGWLSSGAMSLVDVGYSTLYLCRETQPDPILEEATGSECVQAGSIFVDRAMQSHLERKLCSS